MPLCAGVNQMRGPAVQLLLQPLGREIPLKSGPFSPTCCLICPTFASTLKLW